MCEVRWLDGSEMYSWLALKNIKYKVDHITMRSWFMWVTVVRAPQGWWEFCSGIQYSKLRLTRFLQVLPSIESTVQKEASKVQNEETTNLVTSDRIGFSQVEAEVPTLEPRTEVEFPQGQEVAQLATDSGEAWARSTFGVGWETAIVRGTVRCDRTTNTTLHLWAQLRRSNSRVSFPLSSSPCYGFVSGFFGQRSSEPSQHRWSVCWETDPGKSEHLTRSTMERIVAFEAQHPRSEAPTLNLTLSLPLPLPNRRLGGSAT